MDCPSNFARMARLGALTLALPGAGVSTALAQELYARPVGALCAANLSAVDADRAFAARRSGCVERARRPLDRVA